MKIALGMKPRNGPWGGGQAWERSFSTYATRAGRECHTVVRDVSSDCDAVIMTNVKRSETASFLPWQIWLRKRRTMRVIHRVNDCDGRNGQTRVNARQARANWLVADTTVFVSRWLQEQYMAAGYVMADARVIRNASDASIFHGLPEAWNGRETLRLVTHHWSNNVNKGWDIYPWLSQVPGVELTVIGRAPDDIRDMPGLRIINPLLGHALAEELKQHHVYVSASINEPGPMHICEAGAVGLPIVYRPSGALEEYAQRFQHWPLDMTRFVETAKRQYVGYHRTMPNYTSNEMNAEYIRACFGTDAYARSA